MFRPRVTSFSSICKPTVPKIRPLRETRHPQNCTCGGSLVSIPPNAPSLVATCAEPFKTVCTHTRKLTGYPPPLYTVRQVLDEQRVQRSSSSGDVLGVEECKGPDERTFSTFPLLQDEKQDDRADDAVTLYVTVHSDDESKVVPFYFSPTGNLEQVRILFKTQCGRAFRLFHAFLSRHS